MPRWDVHQLEQAIGTNDTPYQLADGMFVCRALPFLVVRPGRPLPAQAAVARSWAGYADWRVAILAGLDIAYAEGAHVVNLSLAVRGRFDPADPLEIALGKLLADDRIVVVAAGNWGDAPGTLSELALVPEVISVGATSSEGRILKISSRGRPEGPWPTVAAEGTDTGPEPLPPGTSFAAPRVSSLCQVLRCVCQWLSWEFVAAHQDRYPVPLPPPSRVAILDTAVDQDTVRLKREIRMQGIAHLGEGERYVGGHGRRFQWMSRVSDRLGAAGLGYEVSSRRQIVRHLLESIADPSICSERTSCGAGFVCTSNVRDYLSHLTPSRFYEAFGILGTLDESQARLLRDLDDELGQLWDPGTIGLLCDLYLSAYEEVIVRVLR